MPAAVPCLRVPVHRQRHCGGGNRDPMRSTASTAKDEALRALLDVEMRRAVPPAVTALAGRLAARAGPCAAAVLFYGSALRDEALDGVLDFYVLVDRASDWPGSWLAASAKAGRAELDHFVRITHAQGLCVSIRTNEFHALNARADHVLDSVTAATAHANHFDLGA